MPNRVKWTKEQAVFVLEKIKVNSYKQVAEELGINEKTLYTRMLKCRKRYNIGTKTRRYSPVEVQYAVKLFNQGMNCSKIAQEIYKLHPEKIMPNPRSVCWLIWKERRKIAENSSRVSN